MAVQHNRKLLDQLRHGLDNRAVEIAERRGAIAARQAKAVSRFIRTVKDIRENRVYAIADRAGRYIGEVSANGRFWIGCRYSQSHPLPAAEFEHFAAAKVFVCSTEPGDPKTMAKYKRRMMFP